MDKHYKPWLKFYKEFITDPKIRKLSAIQQLMFVYLLCLADEKGIVRYVTEEDLLRMVPLAEPQVGAEDFLEKGIVYETSVDAFAMMEKYEMIVRDGEKITILHYEERQSTPLSNAERQAKFRAKQQKKDKQIEQENYPVTKSNEKVTELRYAEKVVKNANVTENSHDSNGKVTGALLSSPLLLNNNGDGDAKQSPTPRLDTEKKTVDYLALKQFTGEDPETLRKKAEDEWYRKAAKDVGMTVEQFRKAIS